MAYSNNPNLLRVKEAGKKSLCVGISYFPRDRSRKYHRIETLLLLCSEWEEVGHVSTEHRRIKIF